jgi:hypothetical protein
MPAINDPYAQFARDVSPSPSDAADVPLFHYTTGPGLLGIVRTRRIWATHFRHLNDRQELESGASLVQQVAVALSQDGSIGPASQSLFRDFVAHHGQYPTASWYNPFIASFSEDGNLLSQWRAYAENGAGYSLGLRLTLKFDVPSALTGSLLRCEYDDTIFRERVRSEFLNVADKLFRYIQAHATGPDDTKRFCEAALHALMVHTVMLAPRFKASAFREEREWRLITFPQDEKADAELTLFRVSRRGLVPYVEIPLDYEDGLLPLTQVYVGPTQDADTGVNAAALFLKHQGYDGQKLVSSSGIPFRSS